ncbi:MAG: hypothetical protein JWR67_1499 [Mucilaginibacter sp.]|nr:hypothetical protein [Mucilaginibacter sp.]
MQSNEIRHLEFMYLNQTFRGSITSLICPDGHNIYKLKFRISVYWFIQYGNKWEVIADFKLCQRLRDTIINAIELDSNKSEYNQMKPLLKPVT